ncbi:MAG: hypothetical protein ACHQZR_01900 [Candidatus Limnocylindrales bacterium]
MSADDFTTALVTGGQAWLVLSIAAVLPILWAFALSMHFARPYVLRFLGTLTLRFGGDVWWLSYVLIRDALMLITLSLSVVFLMPNLYIGLGMPITAPLATVVLFWALVVKLLSDSDDDPRAFTWVSSLLVAASALYIVPQIYGLEAADQVDRLDSFAGLGGIPAALSASTDAGVNPLAWPILIGSLILFALTGAFLFVRFLARLGDEPAPDGGVPTS